MRTLNRRATNKWQNGLVVPQGLFTHLATLYP